MAFVCIVVYCNQVYALKQCYISMHDVLSRLRALSLRGGTGQVRDDSAKANLPGKSYSHNHLVLVAGDSVLDIRCHAW